MSPPNFSPSLLVDLKSLGTIGNDDLFVEASIDLKIVHPLFVREHWEDGKLYGKNMPKSRWEAIEPAIHLVSHLLDKMLYTIPWWSRLMFAQPMEHKSKWYLSEVDDSEELREATRTMLVKIAEVVRFFPERREPDGDKSLACTILCESPTITGHVDYHDITEDFGPLDHSLLINDLSGAAARVEKRWAMTPFIAIDSHSKIWQGFENLHNPAFALKNGTKGQLRRLQYHLAVTLFHDMNHAAFVYTRPCQLDHMCNHRNSIHYYLEDNDIEFGESWEESIFGGDQLQVLEAIPRKLQCLSQDTKVNMKVIGGFDELSGDSSDEESSCYATGYFPGAPVTVRSDDEWYVVPDDFIAKMFDGSVWSQIEEGGNLPGWSWCAKTKEVQYSSCSW